MSAFKIILREKKDHSMGFNLSKNIGITVVKNTQSIAVNELQSIQQTNEQATSVNQNVTIVINGKLTCSSLTVTQDAAVSMRSYSAATADQKLEMVQAIQQAMAANAKTVMDQTNKDLNILQTNLAVTVNQAIEDSSSEQEVNMQQVFEQTVSQTSDVTQTVNFTVGTTGEVYISGACAWNQSATVDYTASTMCNAGMETILAQSAVQQAATSWDTAIKQTNAGLAIWQIALIAIAGVIVLAIIIGVPIGLKKKAEREAREIAEGKRPPRPVKPPKPSKTTTPAKSAAPTKPTTGPPPPKPIPVAHPVG